MLAPMPSTVAQLFAAHELAQSGVVPWGNPVPERSSGVYVVALTSRTDAVEGTLAACPLDLVRLQELLDVRPELRMDRSGRPTAAELATRLAGFWLPDETALYIGRTRGQVGVRLRQYDRHRWALRAHTRAAGR